ncbi:hypothetical protein FUAX_13700 [Fulvitalea axinellae]|uniref:Rhodanese domain-containing protein n=2 Tax=Fulvitalea axinellae TaxID=1182444 RepID=A0AAU9CG17_9BACT|nr:hypothetical protein FUAX_13700 [Fulvitalea axinellae]
MNLGFNASLNTESNMRKSIILSLFCALLAISCQSNAQEKETDIKTLQAKITSEEQFILLDVRTPAEYEAGHLKNAININWHSDEFKAKVSKLDKSKTVYVYCRSGRRSANASEAMRKMGFKKALNVEGGILAWKKEGFKTVQ